MATEPVVAICMPWRPEPHRMAAFERVVAWYGENGYWVTLGDSDPRRPFNLSAARNDAVRSAGFADTVVIADADTLPEPKLLAKAIHRAHRYNRIVYPFTEYHYLGEVDPLTVVDPADVPVQRVYRASVGGLVVAPVKMYWDVGGFDDCFTQWGYEDNAFLMAAEVLGQVERLNGPVWAFSHEAERDLSGNNPGGQRMLLYRYARRDPKLMRELVKRW